MCVSETPLYVMGLRIITVTKIKGNDFYMSSTSRNSKSLPEVTVSHLLELLSDLAAPNQCNLDPALFTSKQLNCKFQPSSRNSIHLTKAISLREVSLFCLMNRSEDAKSKGPQSASLSIFHPNQFPGSEVGLFSKTENTLLFLPNEACRIFWPLFKRVKDKGSPLSDRRP
ncbi:hypothetical protein AVEN_14396-1 [Araneus ventricosus]|uniref:Uncharacterized protein n=1 Tax=Araneus ventricosus TaxID=182803 RepID=A0A4Y2UND0_ARAVE|nr:hypothetical protein AVEN_14396-1 [Araneus ventricosus]